MADKAKHFLHDPIHLVTTSLQSYPLTNPSIKLDAEDKIVYRRRRLQTCPSSGPSPDDGTIAHEDREAKRQPQQIQQVHRQETEQQHHVSLVSGGGSGHEPAFAGYVGRGMLSAAVAGTIFASPAAEQVKRAVLGKVDSEAGVLVVVMNYTGDILSFGMAVEKAKASGLTKIDMIVVGDDVGVGRTQGGKVGRRGIAGTVLVIKIAGALAEKEASFEDVRNVATKVANNLVSIGASLGHVHVPGHPIPDANSDDCKTVHEVEIGMGIHNEQGCERVKTDLPGLVKTMLKKLLDMKDEDRAFLRIEPSDTVVLLVNNLGGVSALEMGGITTEVVLQLKGGYGIAPVRIFSGSYMTSLNGLGFSITLLRVVETGLGTGKEMLELLDERAEVSGWSSDLRWESWSEESDEMDKKARREDDIVRSTTLQMNAGPAKEALTAGLTCLITAEPEITKFDMQVGDGDCGTVLKRGAEAVLKLLSDNMDTRDVVATVAQISQEVERSMDGTSGALYAIFLNALTHSLQIAAPPSSTQMNLALWVQALKESLKTLGKYTPAKPGDRTLMDALYPFVQSLESTRNLKNAAEAAKKGADGTRGIKPSLGRTVYIGGRAWEDVPDPGAFGLSVFLGGLAGV